MKFFLFWLFNFFLIILHCDTLFAQKTGSNFIDSLSNKFAYYRLKKQAGVLYAHFDKTVYTNNENVWFTAYLLMSATSEKDSVLSLILINDDDHRVALDEKFIMINGTSFGNIFLPDTIPSGNYSFMLYTNNVNKEKPDDVFIQQITIKNTSETSFNAYLDLIDTAKNPADGIRKVLLITDTKSPKPLSNIPLTFYAGNKLHPFATGKAKTDKAGQYLFNIPVKDLDIENNVLEVSINTGKEIKNIKLALPVYNTVPMVRFFPEGGSLSDGIKSTVGWEVKNKTGAPYKVSGVLYKDGEAIDTIATNNYGMGRFWFIPKKESRYYVKLLLANSKDSIYNLPKIQSGLPVVTMQNAIADDTLPLTIKNKIPANFYIVVHNYKKDFFSFPVKVNSFGRPIRIILTDIPKGIAEVTVLDSLQRPVAERLFFAHYKMQNVLKIDIDKNEYKTRDQVHLNLTLTDPEGKPVRGLVSIACVQANRLELKKSKDIARYFYLEHELGPIPVKEKYLWDDADDKAYLEDLLLIKGWRKYNWKDLTQSTPADTARISGPLRFKGIITYFGKSLKKPETMLEFKDSVLTTIRTTEKGGFDLNYSKLLTQQDKKIFLFISGYSDNGYKIEITDPFQQINTKLALNYVPVNYNHLPADNNENTESLKNLEHVIRLKEVKIKGGNDNTLYGGIGKNLEQKNDCGDYVCKYNILNCPNHRDSPNNRAPVKGATYTYQGNPYYTYQGCEINASNVSSGYRKEFAGIYYSVEYYPADYLQYNPSAPEYISTIYWKHLYKIIPGKETAIKFYTSDIAGAFKIIVQGVCANDVISAEKTFTVSKP